LILPHRICRKCRTSKGYYCCMSFI